MRKWLCFAVLCAVSASPRPAASSPYFFGEAELLLPSNSDDGFRKETKELVRSLSALGNSSAWKLDTNAAAGGRVGVLFPAGGAGKFGVSAGYIAGPVSKLTLTTGGSVLELERKTAFKRILAEYRKELPMGEFWSFVPGCSAGPAFGKVEMKSADGKDSKTWAGLGWDLSAGFLRRTSKLDLYLAVRYAAFPEFKKDEGKGLPKMEWDTIGFSVGLAFGGGSDSPSVYGISKYEKRKYYQPPAPAAAPSAPAEGRAAVAEEADPVSLYERNIASAKSAFSRGEYEQAVISYNDAFTQLPERDERGVWTLERLGLSLLKLRRYKQAGDVYISAIKTGKGLDLNNTAMINAYLGLAYCLEKEGKLKWAAANYKAAWQRTDNPGTKRSIEEALRKLKNNAAR